MAPKKLRPNHGRLLTRLARLTIQAHFDPVAVEDELREVLDQVRIPLLMRQAATFVTLTKHGALRGCIGTLVARDSIVQGVQDNALQAAFHDYRFSPLTPAELPELTVEVSVLSQPKALACPRPDALPGLLRPGTDGVILQHGSRQATFLPQVWSQLADPMDFLDHLCRKAGLAEGCWRQAGTVIKTYTVQKFTEQSTDD